MSDSIQLTPRQIEIMSDLTTVMTALHKHPDTGHINMQLGVIFNKVAGTYSDNKPGLEDLPVQNHPSPEFSEKMSRLIKPMVRNVLTSVSASAIEERMDEIVATARRYAQAAVCGKMDAAEIELFDTLYKAELRLEAAKKSSTHAPKQLFKDLFSKAPALKHFVALQGPTESRTTAFEKKEPDNAVCPEREPSHQTVAHLGDYEYCLRVGTFALMTNIMRKFENTSLHPFFIGSAVGNARDMVQAFLAGTLRLNTRDFPGIEADVVLIPRELRSKIVLRFLDLFTFPDSHHYTYRRNFAPDVERMIEHFNGDVSDRDYVVGALAQVARAVNTSIFSPRGF